MSEDPDESLRDAWRQIYALRDEVEALTLRCFHLQAALDAVMEELSDANESLWLLGAREKES